MMITWSATILTFLGLASVAHSLTVIDQRRKARSFYGSLIGGTGLTLYAILWSMLTTI